MKINFCKYISILILLVLLNACGAPYVSNQYKFCINSIGTSNYNSNPKFIVCASFYTNEFNIWSVAEIYCFKQNKKPKLLNIKYFSGCSLIKPVNYNFVCE